MDYFAYGSNMNASQMAHRCPNAESGRIAHLQHHRFVINSRGVATIVPDPAHSVIGILWRLGAPEIAILDEYEGVAADRYVRTNVTVTLESPNAEHSSEINSPEINSPEISSPEISSPVVDDAIVYIATDATPGPPRPGYLETILEGAESFGLPVDYRKTLEEWAKA